MAFSSIIYDKNSKKRTELRKKVCETAEVKIYAHACEANAGENVARFHAIFISITLWLVIQHEQKLIFPLCFFTLAFYVAKAEKGNKGKAKRGE